MTVHPLAALFPMMPDAELRSLADDIQANGLQQPIVVQEDVLLDGRNRLKACEMAGVMPEYQEYAGADVQAFIIGANLHRRHLTESQRAMVAEKLANLPNGQREDRSSANLQTSPVSQTTAADLLKVSPRSVAYARTIARQSPELAAQVSAGEKTIHAAMQELRPRSTIKEQPEEFTSSTGLKHAYIAVSELKKIGKRDLQRSQAFNYVKDWIAAQTTHKGANKPTTLMSANKGERASVGIIEEWDQQQA